MQLDEARALIDFNYWARDRLLDAVAPLTPEQLQQDLRNSFPSVRDTLVHIALAEWIWHARWTGHSPTEMPRLFAEFTALDQIRAFWSEQEANIRTFMGVLTQADLTHEISYRTMNGQPGRSSFGEMIRHLVNHGTYHRGQVTTMLRQLGAAPPKSTDLIAFYRERANAGTTRTTEVRK